MEDLLSLLAFLFFFFVLPVLQKKKAEQRRQNQQPADTEGAERTGPRSPSRELAPTRSSPAPTRRNQAQPQDATPFQDALRQIREALEEAQQDQSAPGTEPAPVPRPTRKPTRLPNTQPSPVAAPPPARFDRPSGFAREATFERGQPAHERHGFGRENPLSEETFERRPAFSAEPGARRAASYDPHRLQKPAVVPSRQRQGTLLERLRKSSTAQDALIMAEVLGPPKGKLRR